MRAAAPALLAVLAVFLLVPALALVPAADAASGLPGVAAGPPVPVASPLCPQGDMAAACVRLLPGGQGADAQARLGSAYGPHAAGEAGLALADLDGDGLADPALSVHAEARPCPLLMMVLPLDPPFWPCAQALDLAGSIDL